MTQALQEELQSLSHQDLCEITESSLKRLISVDQLLNDLPVDCTFDEVQAQTAVATGQSIKVSVLRLSEPPITVVIPQQGTTVLDLKKAFRRALSLKLKRLKSCTKISWKYVWKTYNFAIGRTVLSDDMKLVADYGVCHKSELRFVKKLRKFR